MIEYRLTFGQRYRTEIHHYFEGAHPDGWVTILARDYDHARAIAVAALAQQWSDLRPATDEDAALYPRGELLRLDGSDPVIEVP
jgi:hypothetical protein